jgi:hypothetical protein
LKYKVRELPHNNYTSTTTTTTTTTTNTISSHSVYAGISMGIIEYSYLIKNNNMQLSNKDSYEYENDHKHHYIFTVENLHLSQISLHRILGNQLIIIMFSLIVCVSYAYPLS